MTRGSNRRDLPTSGSGFIDYSCPVESWEYWESDEKFAQEFSQKFRIDIARVMFDYRQNSKDYEKKVDRLDAKQIKRRLKAAGKHGTSPDPRLVQLVELNYLGLPDATFAEKANYILSDFVENSDDFLMERPDPKPLFTRVLHDLFRANGFNDLLGSTNYRYALTKEHRQIDPLETAFIEFVRRCIWGEDRTPEFCDKVGKTIQKSPTRRKP